MGSGGMTNGTGPMGPQDWFNLLAPVAARMQTVQPMSFLGEQQQPTQPTQSRGLGALGQQGGGQQGGGAYGQIGGVLANGIKGLAANFGANGNSNTLADMVGFQPFGGGGWGSGE